MIKSFRHKGLQAFFEKGSKSGIQAKHAIKLQIQLTALHTATQPEDMNAPNWKLHKLKGNNPKVNQSKSIGPYQLAAIGG